MVTFGTFHEWKLGISHVQTGTQFVVRHCIDLEQSWSWLLFFTLKKTNPLLNDLVAYLKFHCITKAKSLSSDYIYIVPVWHFSKGLQNWRNWIFEWIWKDATISDKMIATCFIEKFHLISRHYFTCMEYRTRAIMSIFYFINWIVVAETIEGGNYSSGETIRRNTVYQLFLTITCLEFR